MCVSHCHFCDVEGASLSPPKEYISPKAAELEKWQQTQDAFTAQYGLNSAHPPTELLELPLRVCACCYQEHFVPWTGNRFSVILS